MVSGKPEKIKISIQIYLLILGKYKPIPVIVSGDLDPNRFCKTSTIKNI